jgi:hypothetical protein
VVDLLANHVNISKGVTSENGASFFFAGTNGGFFLSFLTIESYDGKTIFSSGRQNQQGLSLSYANIVDNKGSTGILYGLKYGFPVSSCIFSGNTNGPDLIVSGTDVRKFSVTGCQIFGALPSESYWTGELTIVSEVTTMDVETTELRTCIPPSAPWSATRPRSATKPLSQTPDASRTSLFSASWGFPLSPQCSASDSNVHSVPCQSIVLHPSTKFVASSLPNSRTLFSLTAF